MGCLVPLLILALAVYFAIDFGQAYFRFYQFKDAFDQEAQFASTRTDAQINGHLKALADSLEMPPGAELISIARTPNSIEISSDYDEVIRLPLKKERVIHFHPSAEGSLK